MNLPERELRPTAAAAGLIAFAAVSWMVWSRTASRLCLFLCIAALAIAVIDVVWAAVATRRVRLSVSANTQEATVGDSVAVTLALSGPRQFVRVSLPYLSPAPAGVDVPATLPVRGTARTREVVTAVEVEVSSPGVAGLVAFVRRRRVPLARPLYVGPVPVPAAEPFPELFQVPGETIARPAPVGDLVRGVRPYVPGDPRRQVHWRTTARVGDLVVKEVDEVGAPRLVLALDMGGGGLAGERAAGRAAWYALEALRRGYQVALVTKEATSRTVARVVTGPSDVTRRLAAAVAGAPELPASSAGLRGPIAVAGLRGPNAVTGVLMITEHGDSWR